MLCSSRFPAPHLALLAAAAVVLGACQSSPAGLALDDTAPVEQVVSAPGDTAPLDLYFRPLDWDKDESIEVASDGVVLRSTYTGTDHRIEIDDPARSVARFVGLLDGRIKTVMTGSEPDVSTADGPTSVHRKVWCQDNECIEVIEYDYDLTDPSGHGTTQMLNRDSPAAIIDRIRVEIEHREAASSVRVRSPEALDVVASLAR